MIVISIFTISGLSIVTLVVVKRLEEKRKKPFFISEAISKGDIRIREIYHHAVRLYSEGKEKALFLLKRRIPIHSRNSLNKLLSFLKEKREQYAHNMRDSRLLKKPDGISEFFKNMSSVEKGNGEINHTYEDSSQEDKKELE